MPSVDDVMVGVVSGVILVFVLIFVAIGMSAYALMQVKDLEKLEEVSRNRIQSQINHLLQVNKERSDTATKVQHLASLAHDTKLKMIVGMDGIRSTGQAVPNTVGWHLEQLAKMSHDKYMQCVQNCRYEIVKE